MACFKAILIKLNKWRHIETNCHVKMKSILDESSQEVIQITFFQTKNN